MGEQVGVEGGLGPCSSRPPPSAEQPELASTKSAEEEACFLCFPRCCRRRACLGLRSGLALTWNAGRHGFPRPGWELQVLPRSEPGSEPGWRRQALQCRLWGAAQPCVTHLCLPLSPARCQHGQRQCLQGGLLRGHQQVSPGAPGTASSILHSSHLRHQAFTSLQTTRNTQTGGCRRGSGWTLGGNA